MLDAIGKILQFIEWLWGIIFPQKPLQSSEQKELSDVQAAQSAAADESVKLDTNPGAVMQHDPFERPGD